MDNGGVTKERISEVKKRDDGIYLQCRFEEEEASGRRVFKGYMLSDGTTLDNLTREKLEKCYEILKKTTGTDDLVKAHTIISTIAVGMSESNREDRLDHVALMLAVLQPQNEVEALLYGQFLTLQESGMQCLRLAHSQESFYHIERFFTLASKLFAQSNTTMQTLLKYRSRGQQTVQVVHVHNEKGQAIVAQNLSHLNKGSEK